MACGWVCVCAADSSIFHPNGKLILTGVDLEGEMCLRILFRIMLRNYELRHSFDSTEIKIKNVKERECECECEWAMDHFQPARLTRHICTHTHTRSESMLIDCTFWFMLLLYHLILLQPQVVVVLLLYCRYPFIVGVHVLCVYGQ